MFNGLRHGSLLYVLDKSNLALKIGEVTNISNPKDKYGQNPYMPQQFMQNDTTIDVQVKFGDEIHNFEQLPSNMSITSKNNLVVTDNRDTMNAEVEAMIRASKVIIESVPYHEKVLQSCDAMLRELNPQFAKEKEQEEKIGVLEEKMGGIENTLNQMMGLLSDAIGQNKSKRNNKED
jgi:ribosome-associated translation inhibitor RaiA